MLHFDNMQKEGVSGLVSPASLLLTDWIANLLAFPETLFSFVSKQQHS